MSTPTTYARELYLASLAVQSCSVLTKNFNATPRQNTTIQKSDSSLVTLADFAAQALLIGFIHAQFPDDKFVGEENAKALRNDTELLGRTWEVLSAHLKEYSNGIDGEGLNMELGLEGTVIPTINSPEEMCDLIDLGGRGVGGRTGRIWMLDPVDGTNAFLRGEQYAVVLALVVDGEEQVGVLGCPRLRIEDGKIGEKIVDLEGYGLMFSALKGQGAVMRSMGRGALQPGQKIERKDRNIRDAKDLRFVATTITRSLNMKKDQQVAKIIGAEWPGTDIWSSHIRYAALIVDASDTMLRIPRSKDYRSHIWDHAGAHLIYREVGGTLTCIDGKELDFGTGRKLEGNFGMIAVPEGCMP